MNIILDEEEDNNDQRAEFQITVKNIFKIIILTPTTEIDLLLNQTKYKYLTLFPFLFGFISGISRSVSKVGVSDLSLFISNSIGSVITSVLTFFIVYFIFSWIVMLISRLLKGTANINMTYGLISYSLIPMILGSLFYLIFKLVIFSNKDLATFFSNYLFIYYGSYLFLLWSLFILIIGNAYINNFSMLRSFIAAAGLPILLLLTRLILI